jgi:Fe-S-cluster containining protein
MGLGGQAQFIPWRCIADWKCISCGDCCRFYSVVINFHEWLKIVKIYGVEQTVSGLNKLFIRRDGDGSCTFLNAVQNDYSCGLQQMKPKACKLWPFKVLTEPRFGFANEAVYDYGESKLFVYVDSTCNGVRQGRPTLEFSGLTVREFVEIAMNLRSGQIRSTGNMRLPQRYVRAEEIFGF